jgi:hypothetical protein
MKFVILALFLCVGARADEVVAIPETVVQLSISDLGARKAVRKTPTSGPVLPADYGKRLAEVIAGARASLLACLPANEPAMEANAELKITSDGKAVAAVSQKGPAAIGACLENSLSALSYPAHSLKNSVTLRFPLKLSRSIL